MDEVRSADQRARDAAKIHTGEFAWPTVILALFTALAYVAIPLLVAAGNLHLIVALPVMMALTYMAYSVLHESVHGAISGSNTSLRWVNETMGYVAGWILMIPLTAHRHEHLAHHRHTNDADADPDYQVIDMVRSPQKAIAVALHLLRSQYEYYLRNRWRNGPSSQNRRFVLEVIMIVGVRCLLIAQGGVLEMSTLFLLGSLGGVIITLYLFAYLVHRPHGAVGRYIDTSAIVISGLPGRILTVLWGFQNYHAIHHLFPRVPFYRYRELFDEIEELMVEQGTPVYRLTLIGLKATERDAHLVGG